MKTLRWYLVVILFSCNIFISSLKAHGPLAHYSASPMGTNLQQNLPDLWESHVWLHEDNITVQGKEVTEHFGWSHACRREGLFELDGDPVVIEETDFYVLPTGVYYPQTPTVYGTPVDIEKPENDMYYIYSNKLLTENKSNPMLKTAQGFLCHNVEDSYVHFTYYKGGTKWNWIVEHMLKEQWAEYVIWLNELNGYWDAFGNPSNPYTMGCSGHAGIINLAQKVFRKNRQTVDNVPSSEGIYESIDVQSESEIQTLIDNKNTKLSNYFSGNKLTQDNCNKYITEANLFSWNQLVCRANWNLAKNMAYIEIAYMQ